MKRTHANQHATFPRMLWRFSDGTTVELGGKVEGSTVLAQELRQTLSKKRTIQIWAHPSRQVPFDANDAALLDACLTNELEFRVRVRKLDLMLQRPDGIPALPPPPWKDQDDDGETRVY